MTPTTSSKVDSVTIRRADPEDLRGMAGVHVETWKTTYRGLVPDEWLDRRTVEGDIARGFGSWLAKPPPGVAQFVGVSPAGEIVGFALGRPNSGADPRFAGELEAIYLPKPHQGHRVGSALVGNVARHLQAIRRTSMVVWVLECNPYRRFYEHLGGVPVSIRGRRSRLGEEPLAQVSYGWNDIAKGLLLNN